MAILIDMPMPHDCGECVFMVDGWCYCIKAEDWQSKKMEFEERPDWCPLREVVICRECKYWIPDQVGVVEQPYCTRLGFEESSGLDLRIGSADHFCCFGERICKDE